ncbi:LysR family transcriptional regulator [Crenothrix sp. D3]|jgi:DNA-binding transcriptional LysR family regulator|nr:LysR family transcriptional regulator [Crenothrix sp. D3]
MNLSQIELLRVLQETQLNMTKAADKMHIVQSAVSRQLQLFEEELGSPLFERLGKKLSGLTPLGKRVMEEVAIINQAKNNITSIAADFLDSDKGTLHIATTHTQAKYFLPMAIQRFRKKYPNVNIYMVQASPEQLIDQLHTRKADIAICTERVDQETDLVLEKCYDWHHAIVMPHNHPLCDGEITLERLAAYPILTYNFGFTGRSTIDKAFKAKDLELDIVLAAADSDVIKTYVRLGLGVGLIADIAYDAVIDQDLMVHNLAHLIPSSSTKIAYLKNNYLPLFSQHFIEELLIAAREFV